MSGALLPVDKLEVVYHRAITAVQGVSLSVHKGQIVAILGTNGAGKSTTLRAISGFLGIDDARVTEFAASPWRGKRRPSLSAEASRISPERIPDVTFYTRVRNEASAATIRSSGKSFRPPTCSPPRRA